MPCPFALIFPVSDFVMPDLVTHARFRETAPAFTVRNGLQAMKRRLPARPGWLALVVMMVALTPRVAGWGADRPTQHQQHQHMVVPAAAMIAAAAKLPRTGWVATASSEETSAEDGRVAKVLDGDASTFWHSRWSTATSLPQWVTIDMRAAQRVSGLVYTPRPAARANGRIGRYEIRLSADGVAWGNPVATGTLADDASVKTISFAVSSTRYVRLVALSEAGGRGPWASVGEIDLLGDPGGQPGGGDPSVSGSWGSMLGFPIVPVAAALLPNSKLLTWSAYAPDNYGGSHGYTQTAILNLATGQATQRRVDNTGHDMFCPGTSMLADGRVLVTGGSDAKKTSIYDPRTDAWTSGPDLNVARGYQGQTTLSTGEAFTVGGSWSGGSGGKTAEVYSPATNSWRLLPNVPPEPFMTADPGGVFRADNHAWLFATGGGRVFHAGPSAKMHWVDTADQGKVTDAGTRGDSPDAMNGNAVLYDVGKILTLGGAPAYQNADATKAAYTVDITGTTPVVRRVSDMAAARAFANSVVLPDGTVVVLGGQGYPVPFSDQTSVLEPELWNPATGRFTRLAAMAVPRNYHSVAMLLPDGTIFSGGGGLCGSCATNHPDGQIFVPPYLLNADGSRKARPAITSAPTGAAPGATVTMRTDRAVKGFTLMRTSSVTHSVDNDQRRVPLVSTATSSTVYTATIPADLGVVPPGNYLLFALDSAGTPSMSVPITIGG